MSKIQRKFQLQVRGLLLGLLQQVEQPVSDFFLISRRESGLSWRTDELSEMLATVGVLPMFGFPPACGTY